MKKILSLIITVILTVVLVLPFFVGFAAKHQFEKFINESAQEGVKIESSYSRGWFSSTAKTSINLYDLIAQEQFKSIPGIENLTNFIVDIDHQLKHGPFVWNSPQVPVYQPVIATVVNNIHSSFVGSLQPTALATIKINGDISSSIVLPATNHYIKSENVTIAQDPISITFDTSSDFKKMKSRLNISKIKIFDDENSFSIENLASFSNIKNGNLVTDFDFSIANILLNFQDDSFKLNDLKSNGTSTLVKDNLNGTWNLNIDYLNFNDDKYGPLNFSCYTSNINFQALQDLQELQKQAQKLQSPGLNNDSMVLLSQLSEILTRLTQSNPTFNSVLDLSTPQGAINAKLYLQLHKTDQINFTDVQATSKIVSATFDISLPCKFVDDLTANNSNFIAAMVVGMLQKEGDNYVAKVVYDQGKTTVNGNQLPF